MPQPVGELGANGVKLLLRESLEGSAVGTEGVEAREGREGDVLLIARLGQPPGEKDGGSLTLINRQVGGASILQVLL